MPGLRDSVSASGQGSLVEATPEALAEGLLRQLASTEPARRTPPPSWDDTAADLLEVLRGALVPGTAAA